MTTWYVKAGSGNGNGSEAAPFGTLAAAIAVAMPGDEVEIGPGEYEKFRPPAGTTWRAAAGAKPVIDGGWDNRELPPDGDATGALVKARDVTLRGLEIRNVAGNGVTVGQGGHNFVMENCEIHHTLDGAFNANGTGDPILGITIKGCHAHDIALSGRWTETPVNGCFLFKSAYDVLVEDTLIERGYGEGIAAGSRSRRVIFRRVVVRRTRHLLGYVNRAQGVLFEDCIFYQDGAAAFRQGDGHVGAGIVVGDEESGRKDDRWQHSEDVTFRRCLVVNAGVPFEVRNNIKPGRQGGHDGYNTRIQNLVVEQCTFVAGPDTRAGVRLAENELGARVRGAIRKCVFVLDSLAPDSRFRSTASGIEANGNVWSPAVPQGQPSTNWAIGASALVAADAPLVPFDINNYRPSGDGPLVATDIGALRGVPDGPNPPPTEEPPPPPPDPDPDPPPPDPEPEPPDGPEPPLPAPAWRVQLSERERGLVGNCETYATGEPAGLPGHSVMLLVARLAAMLDEKEV